MFSIAEEIEKEEVKGEVFQDIPHLKEADPNEFAVSVCTVSGQKCSYGDQIKKTMDGISAVSTYMIAQDEFQGEKLNIGCEPSGKAFDHMSLLDGKKPHNPLINAGHLYMVSKIFWGDWPDNKYEKYTDVIGKMIQSKRPGYNHEKCLAEQMTSHKNYALLYMLK